MTTPKMIPIVVSSKLLTHVSDGIYRSSGNALKELVSNAYDADAKTVRINTNYPEFDVVTCSDDGIGMTIDQFKELMNGGIGDSHKREGEDIRNQKTKKTVKGRPIIGKLGIGMLAIAQICYDFKVISHHKETKSAFEATINLNPRRSREADETPTSEEVRNQPTESANAKVKTSEESIEENNSKNTEKNVGSYHVRPIDYEEDHVGLLITSNDLRGSFTNQYREDVKKPAFRKIPKDFETYLDEVSKEKSVARKGIYWELFWDLALAAPISYLEKAPFSVETIKMAADKDSRDINFKELDTFFTEIKGEVSDCNFNVILDGVKLYRPVLLPNKKATSSSSRITLVNSDKKIGGLPFNYTGYLFTQGSAIYPEELRGILIRVRNTAIGNYDKSILKYDTVLGFRADWFSGEILVEEGLEGALNIDRNSFNEMNEHYQYLKRNLHKFIREKSVFTEAEKRDIKDTEPNDDSKIENKIEAKLNQRYVIKREFLDEDIPVQINKENKEIIINKNCAYWDKKPSKRHKAEKVMIALELAKHFGENDFNQIFLKLIQEIA
jgi:hypothetical protein